MPKDAKSSMAASSVHTCILRRFSEVTQRMRTQFYACLGKGLQQVIVEPHSILTQSLCHDRQRGSSLAFLARKAPIKRDFLSRLEHNMAQPSATEGAGDLQRYLYEE